MNQLPPEAIAALERGRLIEAIKIVRDSTGLDLKAAKDAVERYANQQEAPVPRQESDWGRGEPEGVVGMQGNGPASVPPAALAALAKGNKVEAVRLTREATGLGLGDAKRLVDNHENPAVGDFGHLPSRIPSHPMAEPGRVSESGVKWLPIVIVLLVVALSWLYFVKGT